MPLYSDQIAFMQESYAFANFARHADLPPHFSAQNGAGYSTFSTRSVHATESRTTHTTIGNVPVTYIIFADVYHSHFPPVH